MATSAPKTQTESALKAAKTASTPKAAPSKTVKAPATEKPAVQPTIKAKKPVAKDTPKSPLPEAESKPKKPKLVRDSFTIPKDEYEALSTLKQRAVQLAQPAKKSELLRAGLKWLTQLDDKAFLSALKAVPAIKTGRPKGDEAPKAKEATKKSKG